MWISDIGIVAVFGALAVWANTFGFWHMAALYLAPLAFTNCWLVLYTWLQVRALRTLPILCASLSLEPHTLPIPPPLIRTQSPVLWFMYLLSGPKHTAPFGAMSALFSVSRLW